MDKQTDATKYIISLLCYAVDKDTANQLKALNVFSRHLTDTSCTWDGTQQYKEECEKVDTILHVLTECSVTTLLWLMPLMCTSDVKQRLNILF